LKQNAKRHAATVAQTSPPTRAKLFPAVGWQFEQQQNAG